MDSTQNIDAQRLEARLRRWRKPRAARNPCKSSASLKIDESSRCKKLAD
jgi:hypothetical protein